MRPRGPKNYESLAEFEREELRRHHKAGWSLDDLYSEATFEPPGNPAPKAGAVLLQADDISSLSGLGDGGSLSSYLLAPNLFGEAEPGPVIVNAEPGFGQTGG